MSIAVDVDEGDLDSAGQDDDEVEADAAVPDVELTQASVAQKRKAGAIQGVTPANHCSGSEPPC